MRRPFILLAASLSAAFAQREVSIEAPPPPKYVGRFLKPFHLDKRVVAAARLNNSSRLESLVRGGNLYLSVRDVIALTLENNLDIAIQRYGPFMAREVLRRAEGGGLLRSDIHTPILLPGPPERQHRGRQQFGQWAGDGGLGGGGGIVSQIGPTASESGSEPLHSSAPGTSPRRKRTLCSMEPLR